MTQPPRVWLRAVWLVFICACVCGCDDSSPFVFEAVIVDAEGGNPAAGTDASALTIGLQEGTLPARETEFPVVDETFDAAVEFESFVVPARVRVSLEGETTDLLTAPPQFVPSLSGGLMRLVTTPAASCARVSFNMMEAPRAFLAMVQSGTFALVVSGTEASLDQVEFLDALEWESRLFLEEFSLATLGPTRATSIDETRVLVLPQDATAFVFDMEDPQNRVTPLVLHPGAGPASALVSVTGIGAFVIGGEVGGEPQSAISVVDAEGLVTSRSLSTPRAGPSATVFGENVLIVGGDGIGSAEILRAGTSTGQPTASLEDGTRDASLLVGDGVGRALLLGGIDSFGTVRQDTVAFDGCPDECTSAPGPTWSRARLESFQPEGSALVIGGADSADIDKVRFEGADVEIAALFDLVVPRAGASGIVLESGAFIVGGGSDGVSPRDDFEFCVPAALEPLE
ncbi:MAG: hypothetical protein AAF997_09230 [Myxococcota bacterium]